MAEYTIDKIEYDGNVYKLQDTKVTQTEASSGVHEVLLDGLGSDTTYTGGVYKSELFEFDTDTGLLSIMGPIEMAFKIPNTTINESIYQGPNVSTEYPGSSEEITNYIEYTGYTENNQDYEAGIAFSRDDWGDRVTLYSVGVNRNTIYLTHNGIEIDSQDNANATYSNITLTEGAISLTVQDDVYVNGDPAVFTDRMLSRNTTTSSATYYPLVSGSSNTTTDTANVLQSGINYYQYYNTAGGYRQLRLGTTTTYTSSGGAYGSIRLYGTGATYYGDLNPGTIGANSLTANRTWTLPDATGTIALTSDIPSIPTIPTISLNGSSTTSASFYAPTTAGTSGQVLQSNGSGAPTWANSSGHILYGTTAPSVADGEDGDIYCVYS